eukprot:c40279_g1_i1 orf=383-565(-)
MQCQVDNLRRTARIHDGATILEVIPSTRETRTSRKLPHMFWHGHTLTKANSTVPHTNSSQ